MADIPRLIPGSRVPGIPAEGWNRMAAATRAVEQMAGTLVASPGTTGGLPAITVDVTNSTTAARDAYHIVGLDGVVFEPSGTDPPTEQLALKAVTPNEEKQFGILTSPLANSSADSVKAVVMGQTWVQIDIQDEENENCGVEDDEFEHLVSGKGSTPIVWKPEGTGVKWCVVQLGGGGGARAKSAHGLLIASIGGATLDGTTKEITPGLSDDAIVALKWSDDGAKLEEDETLQGANLGKTGVRGSVSDPVAVVGAVETVDGSKRFVISPSPIDVRILPDWVLGASPSGGDDPDMQILHHKGGSHESQLGSEDCGGS